jgi:hypothetical protein
VIQIEGEIVIKRSKRRLRRRPTKREGRRDEGSRCVRVAVGQHGGRRPRDRRGHRPRGAGALDGRGNRRGNGARGPFGKAAPTIAEALEKAGYARLAVPVGFTVAGRFGPLRRGELERARRWGGELVAAMG